MQTARAFRLLCFCVACSASACGRADGTATASRDAGASGDVTAEASEGDGATEAGAAPSGSSSGLGTEPPPQPPYQPGCPFAFSTIDSECSPVGLLCQYPGQGDLCGTAILRCEAIDAGSCCSSCAQDDGGSDAADAADGTAVTGCWAAYE